VAGPHHGVPAEGGLRLVHLKFTEHKCFNDLNASLGKRRLSKFVANLQHPSIVLPKISKFLYIKNVPLLTCKLIMKGKIMFLGIAVKFISSILFIPQANICGIGIF
jgi:hypothetical protein